jgi:hypothetical protein
LNMILLFFLFALRSLTNAIRIVNFSVVMMMRFSAIKDTFF